MMFYMVPSLLLQGNLKLKYESFCSQTTLIFLYFSLISHVFINIREKLNLMSYNMDHFGKQAVSKHVYQIRFGTIGHLTTEIRINLEVPPPPS